MMKRKILAIMIPALLASATNAAEIYNKEDDKIDLYGNINTVFLNNNEDKEDKSNPFMINLGIKGDTFISENIRGYGELYIKNKINNQKHDSVFSNTLAYVGLNFDNLGSIDYGRNYGILHNINSWTSTSPVFNAYSMSPKNSYMSGINDNLFTYRNNNFFGLVDGLELSIQYQGKNSYNNKNGIENNKEYLKNNGKGFGISATYDIGWGIKLGGAYTKSYRNFANQTPDDDNKYASGWNTGIKYDWNNLYLAAMYGKNNYTTRFGHIVDNKDMTSLSRKTENIEITGKYLFDDIGFQPTISYVHTNGTTLINNEKQNLTKYVSLGAAYKFNNHLSAAIDYKINLIKNNSFTQEYGINHSNTMGVGIIYRF